MKRCLLGMAAFALLISAPAIMADGDGLGIAGSPHDLSTETWNHRGEICRVCHIPHDHDRNVALGALGLLWDHQVSSVSYLMYAEDTHTEYIDGAADAEPTGITKMCLGCHDGSVGIDQFDSKADDAGTVFMGTAHPDFQIPGASLPGDLSNTHPLGIVYDAGADGGLHPTTNAMGASGTIADVLDGGKIACSSCHDVHNSPGESVPDTHLLRVSNNTETGNEVASGLCLTCHDK